MKKLRVHILRGKNKVGENLIEITDGDKKLLLEYGTPLMPTKEAIAIEGKVLDTFYDAIIITHCHADHCGLLRVGTKTNVVCMGAATYKILSYCNGLHQETGNKLRFLKNEESFWIGKIKITPYLCDHSAYDSYMILIEKEEERILYTGDFRGNGRKNFPAFLKRLPNKVDLLITEGTNLTENKNCCAEKELEEQALEMFSSTSKIFVLQSTLNIDRTVTFYRASKRTRRRFIQTLSSADICCALKNIPNPLEYNDCYTYLNRGVGNERYEQVRNRYGKKLLSKNQIAKMDDFVMQVSGSFLSYFNELSKLCDLSGSIFVYSLWEGYKKDMQNTLEKIEKMGIEIINLHTSGHADVHTLKALQERVNPQETVFVHRESMG